MSNPEEPEVIERVYTYMRNGKEVTVRRRWTKNNKASPKHTAVKSYFDNNMDSIRSARNIRVVYNDFIAQNPEVRCSYSTLYAYYQSVFNTRRSRTAPEPEPEAQAGSEGEPGTDLGPSLDPNLCLGLS